MRISFEFSGKTQKATPEIEAQDSCATGSLEFKRSAELLGANGSIVSGS
jgi:hypothetical protein